MKRLHRNANKLIFHATRRQVLALAVLTSLFLLLAGISKLSAQDSCSLRISIITCGVGNELYSCYGHSAVRIVDRCAQSDMVYNYGTFDFNDPEFYSKFTRGKLPYYLNIESFQGFIGTYVREGRSVHEQVLKLPKADAMKVQAFLNNNAKEENKYYRYDFLLDNCSTRIRDIFTKLFDNRFVYGHSMANDSCSFRTILDYYEREKHWERVGVNLLMSDIIDRKMTNLESMFLPDYLMKGFAGARLDDDRVVGETLLLLPAQQAFEKQINIPMLSFWLLLLIVVFVSFTRVKTILPYFDVLFFLILGLLGCFMLFMWFGTEHAVCAWNRNLYWAFPLHVVFAFMIPRQSVRLKPYAYYTSWLVVLSMFYGFVAEQKYMPEITPILLLILFRLSQYSSQTLYFAWNRK